MAGKNVELLDLDNVRSHDEVLTALKALYADKQITDLQYYKGVVGIAADIAKDGDLMTAKAILALAPPEYFQLVQLREMQADPLYAEVAAGLAGLLVRYGLDRDCELAPTQSMGQA